MKKITCIIILLLAGNMARAQADTTAPYLRNRHLPDFRLLNIDSLPITPNILPDDKNIVLMLFSPDCEHCQKQLDELLSIGEIARTTRLVLISIMPLKETRAFYQKNRLEKYPYITLAQDYKGFFVSFYRPKFVPVLAFYNKKRQFVSINYGNANTQKVLDCLKELDGPAQTKNIP